MSLSNAEFQKILSERVADRINPSTFREQVRTAVRPCNDCREAFERELDLYMVERKRNLLDNPAASRPAVLDHSLLGSSPAPPISSSRRGSTKKTGAGLVILLVVILGLGAYLAFFNDSKNPDGAIAGDTTQPVRNKIPEPTRRSKGPTNAFNFAIDNYSSLVNGQLGIVIQETDLTRLKEAFTKGGIPPMEFTGASLPLKGGIIGDHKGRPVPHVIYSDGTTWLYVTEFPKSQLLAREGLYVTEDVLELLAKGEQIWMEAPSRGNLVMFGSGESVIVGVANRTKFDTRKILGLPEKPLTP